MKSLLNAPILFFIILLTTCTTYDSAVIYHKNFQPGKHALLRFDGYYTDTIGPKLFNRLDKEVKPLFFYSEGSAFSMNNYVDQSTLAPVVQHSQLQGSWGHYKISGDSIQLEKFVHNVAESNYDRILLKGIISKDEIHWFSRKDRYENFKPVDYTVYFTPFSAKPDSTQNWIRKKKKYNP